MFFSTMSSYTGKHITYLVNLTFPAICISLQLQPQTISFNFDVGRSAYHKATYSLQHSHTHGRFHPETSVETCVDRLHFSVGLSSILANTKLRETDMCCVLVRDFGVSGSLSALRLKLEYLIGLSLSYAAVY